jgi:LemA protein
MITLYIVLGSLVLLSIIIYNGLISKRNQVQNAYSSIDVMLKKRADLIPNLVATVKGYAKHEQALFEQVAKLRTTTLASNTSPADRFTAENQLAHTVNKIIAVGEAYPDLKANQQFMQLMASLNETEEQISAARRAYNAAVNIYNTSVDLFPVNILARLFSFQRLALFQATEADKVTTTRA